MNIIVQYFNNELNKYLFEKQNIETEFKRIDNELSELQNQKAQISSHSESSDYVFNVDCYEKAMDNQTLSEINQREEVLNDKKSNLMENIEKYNLYIEKFKKLRSYAEVMCANDKLQDNVKKQLEFILKIMDSDPQRAKLEITNLLKEEKTNAN